LPSAGNLNLNNLVYEEILDVDKLPVEEYYKLLDKQGIGYSPQPYEQLAKILRISGREDIATKILIKSKEDEYTNAEKSFKKWIKYFFLKWTLGFGFKTLRPLKISFGFILFGWLIFWVGFHSNIIIPVIGSSNDQERLIISSEFHPFVYSLDAFIPFIELPQAEIWLPDVGKGNRLFIICGTAYYTGGLILFYLYFHTVMGWLFITLFIVGLSGIIKK